MAMPGGRMSNWGLKRKAALAANALALAENYGPARKFRKKASGKKGASIIRFPYHFADQPQRKYVKLRYVTHINGAGVGAAALVSYQFRANGMYDPEVAVGGHQPYGLDQLNAQYFHWTVLKSTIRATHQDISVNPTIAYFLACHTENGAPAAAFAAGGANGVREMPMVSRDIQITPGNNKEQYRSTTLSADCCKIFGKPAWSLIGDSRFQGSDTADPTEDLYFSFNYYVPTGAAVPTSCMVKIEIVYYAVFTEPRWFTTS